jgi:hypothetical protein
LHRWHSSQGLFGCVDCIWLAVVSCGLVMSTGG